MKKLTPNQKEVLRRLLYENLAILETLQDDIIFTKLWKWGNEGKIHPATFRALKSKGMLQYEEKTDGGILHYCQIISSAGVRAAADLAIVEKAIKLLSPDAEKFHPREERYYFEAQDGEENCIDEFHSEEMQFVCEKCVEEVRGEFQEKVDSDVAFGVPKSATISAEQDTCSEVEGFCYCDKCTELIASSTLPSRDEIDHWENEIKEESFFDKLWPQESYELTGVLEWHTDDPDFTPRIEKIARLLVDGAEKKNKRRKNDNR